MTDRVQFMFRYRAAKYSRIKSCSLYQTRVYLVHKDITFGDEDKRSVVCSFFFSQQTVIVWREVMYNSAW